MDGCLETSAGIYISGYVAYGRQYFVSQSLVCWNLWLWGLVCVYRRLENGDIERTECVIWEDLTPAGCVYVIVFDVPDDNEYPTIMGFWGMRRPSCSDPSSMDAILYAVTLPLFMLI